MKQAKITLIMLLGLFVSLNASAQSVVTGSNLNIGSNNTLTESGTTYHGNAVGQNHCLNGAHSLAVGQNDSILDGSQSSVALGTNNRIIGNGSVAFGNGIKIQGQRNTGIGNEVKALGTSRCMVIGSGLLGNTLHPDLYLENSHAQSLMIGFKSTRPTLTVGPSPNDYPAGDTISKTGKVAIGDVPMTDMAAKLHIRSDYGEDAGLILEPKDKENSSTYIKLKDEDHGIMVDELGEMTLSSMNGENLGSLVLNGRVGINITNESEDYVLAVNGGVLTDEVFIKNVDEWFDHVFAKDYKLMSLYDLHCYVNNYGHLPEVPAETEVLEEGYNMGEMQGLLLKKIEELTLYTIEQQQQIERLEQRINELERK